MDEQKKPDGTIQHKHIPKNVSPLHSNFWFQYMQKHGLQSGIKLDHRNYCWRPILLRLHELGLRKQKRNHGLSPPKHDACMEQQQSR